MKRRDKKRGKVTKGMPTAVSVSILIHAGLFLLAGMFVVFTVVKQKDVEFAPPRAVDRPKMKLKKPKPKLKKNARPKQVGHIAARPNPVNMPDIQLPDVGGGGLGEAFGGVDFGGFDTLPDLDEPTLFGATQSIGNDLMGTFYDFKRDRAGRDIPMDETKYAQDLKNFVRNGWKSSTLGRYYRSPKKLFTTNIMFPLVLSTLAPTAFGEPDTIGYLWAIHYTGELVYTDDITFRFWGSGDDFIVVAVDNQVVLNGSYPGTTASGITPGWQTSSAASYTYHLGGNEMVVGDWITLKAGEPRKLDVLVGEIPGGHFSAQLLVEVKGVKYKRSRQNGPLLPMFATAPPSRDLLDIIYSNLVQGEAIITNGPIFCDYDTTLATGRVEEVADNSEETEEPEPEKSVWTSFDGREIKARYVTLISNKAVLKTSSGKLLKIPVDKLSVADRKYIELMNPPKFDIDFVKLAHSQPNRYRQSPKELEWGVVPPRVIDYTFGVKLRQRGTGIYNHKLTVEYFAVGKELLGNKFILHDRQSSTFFPSEEDKRSFSFFGSPIEIIESDIRGQPRGTRPTAYLITLTDERGQVIQHKESTPWLWEHVNNLKRLPVGAYMDKNCTRVFPTSPKPLY